MSTITISELTSKSHEPLIMRSRKRLDTERQARETKHQIRHQQQLLSRIQFQIDRMAGECVVASIELQWAREDGASPWETERLTHREAVLRQTISGFKRQAAIIEERIHELKAKL